MSIFSLKIGKYSVAAFFYSIIAIAFAYAGMIKNFSKNIFSFDITTALFIFLLITFAALSHKNKIVITKPFHDTMFFLTIISAIMTFSLFYTISENYSVVKTMRFIFLNIGSFIIAYSLVNMKLFDIEKLKLFLFIATFCVAILFIYLQISGKIINYFYGNQINMYPDYLAIGSFLGTGAIINFNKKNILYLIHRLVVIASIVILGARGPLLFLFIVLLFFGLKKWTTRQKLIYFSLLILFIIVLSGTSIAARMIFRFSKFALNEGGGSVSERLMLANKAVDMIVENPVFGVGIGGFGKYVSNIDGRLYPHNIFLEIFSENGIFAFLVWLILFIYLFLYLYRKYEMQPEIYVVYLVCLFLFFQTLKSSELLDSRILFFWLGIFISQFDNNNRRIDGAKALDKI
jgi:O-antigen ligase